LNSLSDEISATFAPDHGDALPADVRFGIGSFGNDLQWRRQIPDDSSVLIDQSPDHGAALLDEHPVPESGSFKYDISSRQ
jgi:hypothetical protein